jgi:transposase
MRLPWCGCFRFWNVDDPGFFERAHLDCDRLHRHAQGHAGFVIVGAGSLGRDPFAGDVFVFRGRGGSLIKALWHDGIGLSLYAKRLDRGRFVWPVTVDGVVALTAAQIRGGRRAPDNLRKAASACKKLRAKSPHL